MENTRRRWLSGIAAATLLPGAAQAQDARAAARRRMVANIEQLGAAGALPGVGRPDPEVLRVMGEVPRHLFIPEAVRGRAYDDTALPIGHDATISQPLIVAAMTSLLDVEPNHSVLEVGTGSGYQAAVLARLAGRVWTVEISAPLANAAAERLKRLGYGDVAVRAGDGYAGWPEHAPFDRIMVTAGATHIPQPLVRQLKSGGRMVIPVGPTRDRQRLTLVTKDAQGRTSMRRLASVIFIPLDERAAPRRD